MSDTGKNDDELERAVTHESHRCEVCGALCSVCNQCKHVGMEYYVEDECIELEPA